MRDEAAGFRWSCCLACSAIASKQSETDAPAVSEGPCEDYLGLPAYALLLVSAAPRTGG